MDKAKDASAETDQMKLSSPEDGSNGGDEANKAGVKTMTSSSQPAPPKSSSSHVSSDSERVSQITENEDKEAANGLSGKKRAAEVGGGPFVAGPLFPFPKKLCTTGDQDAFIAAASARGHSFDDDGPPPVFPSEEGTTFFTDNDVLSGRGGGTNVHPGNRYFRDLINYHRRAYLKARKNDKPIISRVIVRAVRERGGRFLVRDDSTGLYLEIGDKVAREKASQALRQRAPEMRRILFASEREHVLEQQIRQQQQLISSGYFANFAANYNALNPMLAPPAGTLPPNSTPANDKAPAGIMNKGTLAANPYASLTNPNMMTAAFLRAGINPFAPNDT